MSVTLDNQRCGEIEASSGDLCGFWKHVSSKELVDTPYIQGIAAKIKTSQPQ